MKRFPTFNDYQNAHHLHQHTNRDKIVVKSTLTSLPNFNASSLNHAPLSSTPSSSNHQHSLMLKRAKLKTNSPQSLLFSSSSSSNQSTTSTASGAVSTTNGNSATNLIGIFPFSPIIVRLYIVFMFLSTHDLVHNNVNTATSRELQQPIAIDNYYDNQNDFYSSSSARFAERSANLNPNSVVYHNLSNENGEAMYLNCLPLQLKLSTFDEASMFW